MTRPAVCSAFYVGATLAADRSPVAIERMEAGDPAFWKMLLDRVWPARVELSAETESVVEFRWAGGESELPR